MQRTAVLLITTCFFLGIHKTKLNQMPQITIRTDSGVITHIIIWMSVKSEWLKEHLELRDLSPVIFRNGSSLHQWLIKKGGHGLCINSIILGCNVATPLKLAS